MKTSERPVMDSYKTLVPWESEMAQTTPEISCMKWEHMYVKCFCIWLCLTIHLFVLLRCIFNFPFLLVHFSFPSSGSHVETESFPFSLTVWLFIPAGVIKGFSRWLYESSWASLPRGSRPPAFLPGHSRPPSSPHLLISTEMRTSAPKDPHCPPGRHPLSPPGNQHRSYFVLWNYHRLGGWSTHADLSEGFGPSAAREKLYHLPPGNPSPSQSWWLQQQGQKLSGGDKLACGSLLLWLGCSVSSVLCHSRSAMDRSLRSVWSCPHMNPPACSCTSGRTPLSTDSAPFYCH